MVQFAQYTTIYYIVRCFSNAFYAYIGAYYTFLNSHKSVADIRCLRPYSLVDLYSPAELVRESSPLNSGKCIVKLLSNLTDLTIVYYHLFSFGVKRSHRRYNSRCTCTECLVELACLIRFDDLSKRKLTLLNGVATFLEYLDTRSSCNTGEDVSFVKSGGNNLTVYN